MDGDGDLDLFVTSFGGPPALPEQWGRHFTDVTGRAGVCDTLWCVLGGFADVDHDGDLDLYVVNYVDFSLANHKLFGDSSATSGGTATRTSTTASPPFLGSRGDGTFEDATRSAGFGGAVGPGLGMVFGDVDNDGWEDLYVANDNKPNFLFRNKGRRHLRGHLACSPGPRWATPAGPEAGMGVDMGDYDGDGLLDIVVTNFELETNGLYRNLGGGAFVDSRAPARIAEPSLIFLAFGVAFADFDQDGDLDLAIANGNINPNAARVPGGEHLRPAQPGVREPRHRQVPRGQGDGHGRRPRPPRPGHRRPRRRRRPRRGDRQLDEPCEVYENTGAGGHWLGGFRRARRQPLRHRRPPGAGGRRAQEADPRRQGRLLLRLAERPRRPLRAGQGRDGERLTVRRPGRVDVFRNLPANRRLVIE